MKSLREWILENAGTEEMGLRRLAGGSMMSVSPKLKNMLKSRMMAVMKEFENEDPMQLFESIMAATLSLLADMKGTRISIHQAMDALHRAQPENEVPESEDM